MSFTLAVADVETTMIRDGAIPRTLFWGLAIEGEGYRRFNTSFDLALFLEQRRDPLCIYCHTQFDMLQFGIVDRQEMVIRDTRGGRILRALTGKHEWRDSYAIFESKLEEILACAGFKKPPLSQLEERNRADTEDALHAFRAIEKRWYEAWGHLALCQRSLTAASLVFHEAEKRAGLLPRYRENRDAYRGGRTEAFRIHRRGRAQNADLYDINSSYPYSFIDAPDRDTLIYADVEVKDGANPSPFCLWQPSGAKDRKLMFPTGRFHTAFFRSSYERYIGKHPGVKQVRPVRSYKVDMTWFRALRPMILRAYAMRQEAKARGDSAMAYATKIGLNSLYGRLGLNDTRQIAIFSEKVAGGDSIGDYYEIPGRGFLSFKEVKTQPAANYLLAAYITCNARARLYDALRSSCDPIYCDTDSVFVPAGTPFPLEQGKALGAWKFEGTAPLEVRTLKDYTWGDKVALKGGHGKVEWTLRRALGREGARLRIREARTEYDKRTVLYSGATLPIRYDDW